MGGIGWLPSRSDENCRRLDAISDELVEFQDLMVGRLTPGRSFFSSSSVNCNPDRFASVCNSASVISFAIFSPNSLDIVVLETNQVPAKPISLEQFAENNGQVFVPMMRYWCYFFGTRISLSFAATPEST